MRRLYIIPAILMALTALAGCSKMQSGGDMVSASFTVSAGALTRASVDGDGDAAAVNRYIMEVYREDNGAFYDRVEKTVPSGTREATIDINLVIGQTYSFVFWADCSNAGEDKFYDTHSEGDHGLQNVRMAGQYSGNVDSRDAYFASVTKPAHHAFEEKIILTRPFAQVNIITNDIADITLDRLLPSSVSVKVEAYTSFDALKGEAKGSPAVLEYTAQPYYQAYKPESAAVRAEVQSWTLSMDYLFASSEKEVLTQIGFESTTGDSTMTRTFENIPYRRNYRTNVYGSILTVGGRYSVLIDPEFKDPDHNL